MTHFVIDGYNYINRIRPPGMGDTANLEFARRSFLDRLVRYKKTRPARITVVFDAYRSFSTGRQKENHKGVDVVYSREGETADDVIIEMIRRKGNVFIVVSSDRAIIDEAKAGGVPFITPVKMEAMIAAASSGFFDKEDVEPQVGAAKKGNPRRLPKKLRRVSKTLNKAWSK